MLKVLNFLGSLTQRFQVTSGFILLFLLLNTFVFVMGIQISGSDTSPGSISSGNLFLLVFLLLYLINWVSLVVGICIFIGELAFIADKPKEIKPSIYSGIVWVLILLGTYPTLALNEPWLHLQEKTSKTVEAIRYQVFFSPTEKLQYDLDKGQVKNIILYLKQGADINTQDSRGETALIEVIKHEDYKLAKELVSQGADINIKDNAGNNALSNALSVTSRHSILDVPKPNPEKAKMALFLLDKGAAVKIPLNFECSTSVQGAVETGSIELVDKLLKAGLSVNGKGTITHTSPNSTVTCGTTPPIFGAAEMGDNAMISYLIDKGANINATLEWDHSTPLMSSMQKNHPDTALFLISKGANVNARDKEGNSILTLAVRYKMTPTVVKKCLESGAILKPSEPERYPPLFEAIWQIRPDLVKLLLENGANVNERNFYGYTLDATLERIKEASSKPGHSNTGLSEVIDLLKKHGAKI